MIKIVSRKLVNLHHLHFYLKSEKETERIRET